MHAEQSVERRPEQHGPGPDRLQCTYASYAALKEVQVDVEDLNSCRCAKLRKRAQDAGIEAHMAVMSTRTALVATRPLRLALGGKASSLRLW